MEYVLPAVVGAVYALLMTLIREPHRRRFNAVMLAGAGAVYLGSGGFGAWEFAFTALVTYVAFRGLDSWTYIGVGWLLHAAWDAAHHLYGVSMLPFVDDASLGCAICDPVIALWCFAGGVSVRELLGRGRKSATRDEAREATVTDATTTATALETTTATGPAPTAR